MFAETSRRSRPALFRLAASVCLLVALAGATACRAPDEPTSDTGVAADARVDTGDDAPEPIEVGETCRRANSCVEGARCIGRHNEGFECMKSCESDEEWQICEDGSVCTPVTRGPPVCYTGGDWGRAHRCDSNLECEPGLLCFGVDTRPNYCLPACHASDGGCAGDEVCRTLTAEQKGLCRDAVGASCSGAAICPEDLTCTRALDAIFQNNFNGGYCTRPDCNSNSDCPAGSACRSLPDSDKTLCLDDCKTEADCRLTSDYVCLQESDCDRAADPESCRDFRGGRDLCVPVTIGSWDGN